MVIKYAMVYNQPHHNILLFPFSLFPQNNYKSIKNDVYRKRIKKGKKRKKGKTLIEKYIQSVFIIIRYI